LIKKTIGIIGAGNHFYKNIFPILKKSKKFQIISALKYKKKKLNGIIFESEKSFFKRKLDFVYISVPNSFHEKYIIKSLKSNFNVICEKPFVIKKNKINKIINLSKKKNKLIFEAFMYFYHPVFSMIKKIIQSKKYGKLKYIVSNWKHPSLSKKSNQYSNISGKGFWFDGGAYLLSFDNFFFKKKKVMKTIKIKNKVILRGNIYFFSENVKRYYFWGEGQNYRNDLELFFSKGTVFVEQFYAKRKDDILKLKIFYNHKTIEKKINNPNHFELMFNNIYNNYKKKTFQKIHRKKIINQLNYLTRLS